MISIIRNQFCNYYIQFHNVSYVNWLLHQPNVCWSLQASGRVWELSDQNARVIKSQRSLGRRSGLPVQLQVPGSADDKPGSTWEHWQQAWVHVGVPVTNLGVPTTSLEAPTTSLEAYRSTNNKAESKSNYWRAVWETQHLLGNAACVPWNYSYYISFNDL